MDPAPAPLGVAAAPVPPVEWPDALWQVAPQGDLPPVPPPAAAPAWPPAAQRALALLLAGAVGLLGWHAWAASRGGARPTSLSSPVDLNTADSSLLRQLPGVGPSLAGRIEEHRQKHGGFNRIDDLRQVQGVGPARMERLRPLVAVESGSGQPPPPRLPARAGKKPALVGTVNINTASAEELRRLPGIGPKLSERIVEARRQKPFRSADDLRRVRGIGAKTLQRLRPHVTAGAAP